jgi:hypothetical protein
VARAQRRWQPRSALTARPYASASTVSTQQEWRLSRTGIAPGARPPTTHEQTATVIATALTKPETLGLPFSAWTLDRLATYLHEAKGFAMQRSRIDEILLHEGLRWRKHETWFGEWVEPARRSIMAAAPKAPSLEPSAPQRAKPSRIPIQAAAVRIGSTSSATLRD